MLKAGVSSDIPSRDFSQFLRDEIEPAFGKIEGVGQVSLVGGDVREIKINLDGQKVRAYGLSIARVTQLVRASNLDFPTGAVKGQETQSIVRISGKFRRSATCGTWSFPTPGRGGYPAGRYRGDRRRPAGLHHALPAERQSSSASTSSSRRMRTRWKCVRVKEAIRELEQTYPERPFRFEVVSDASLFTIEAADAVKEDLLMAILLVAAVMFLFLHSVRNSVIVLIAIPASLIVSTMAMWALDYSLNLMTLLALSLVIGILVDDSIVVLENIHHHLERKEPPREAALNGRNEIGFAALSITLVDVVVFVPLTLVVGLVGDIMRNSRSSLWSRP